MTILSVNLNKIAVVRNSRGAREPSVVDAARACLDAGAQGITVHPRPDARHIRADDVRALAELTRSYGVELNVEGNPFSPARGSYPGFLPLCKEVAPAQATLVPDGDAQLTSDHGFDFDADEQRLCAPVSALKALGCRVSVLADAGGAMQAAARSGADRIELYTGPFALAFAAGDAATALAECSATAREAQAVGVGVNAGHDLSQANLRVFLHGVAAVREVSIGHALIGEALYAGLAATVRRYLAILAGG